MISACGAQQMLHRNSLKHDAHRAQTTERVKTILTQECKTTLGLVPPGATSKVQPLDVTFNAEFKKSVDRLATEHLSTNPEQFMTGKVTAGDRRVLFTKWWVRHGKRPRAG